MRDFSLAGHCVNGIRVDFPRMNFDVCILGGGLAGQLLARQLRRYVPALRIALFEKEAAATYKVGESTVEIASDYLVRKLGLSSHLYTRQLPKNGLRFFFDSPARDVALEEMSEIGGVRLRGRAAFQLDRIRLEADLRELNGDNGVALFAGHKVTGVALTDSGTSTQPHRVTVDNGDGERQVTCRWVVDATGRHSIIARAGNLRVREPIHHCMAVWGRFREVADLDDWGPKAFRERVRYTSRMLSTTHFSYPGYWIWFIPLGRGVTSVGVVIDRNFLRGRGLGTPRGFLEFLNEHRAVAELLTKAKLEAIGSLGRLAYNSTRYFSPARWGLTGEAAAFSDPLYSPGSDFIALANDFLTNLIEADFQGTSPDALARRALQLGVRAKVLRDDNSAQLVGEEREVLRPAVGPRRHPHDLGVHEREDPPDVEEGIGLVGGDQAAARGGMMTGTEGRAGGERGQQRARSEARHDEVGVRPVGRCGRAIGARRGSLSSCCSRRSPTRPYRARRRRNSRTATSSRSASSCGPTSSMRRACCGRIRVSRRC